MKTMHIHLAWAVAALALAAAASMVARRAEKDPPQDPARPAESRSSSAALRARIAELEAELGARNASSSAPAEAAAGASLPAKAADAPDGSIPRLKPDQILALLKSPNRDDQARAIREIEALPDRAQKLALLREMVAGGSSQQVSRAVSLLKTMAGPEAVALILDVLQKDGPSGPRCQAALALGELGDASAIPALQEAWRTGDLQLRTGAAVGLDRFGQREPAQAALRTLAGMLDSADGGAREDAVDLLTKIPVPGSLPLLVKALGDASNNHLREDAADAMGAQRLTDALPFLEKALQDPSANVREAAQRAINKIRSQRPQ